MVHSRLDYCNNVLARLPWSLVQQLQSVLNSAARLIFGLVGWLLGFYDSTRDKDDTTVGVGHSRRYCNTGYDQSQGRRPSTLKCIAKNN